MNYRTIKLVLFLFCLSTFAFGQSSPKREFRGAWIQAVNGQFQGMGTDQLQQLLISQLNSLQEAGINAIIFQIRPEADALYRSSIEPWSRFLTGTQGKAPEPMWDPMSFMVDECHKRGMEFHAWINPYRVKTNNTVRLAPTHIYWQHPEWFIEYGNQTYFNPGLPESRKYICNVITDIVKRYDIDAIHMDDYFYPYPVPGKEIKDELTFARYGMGFSDIKDWRRDNVNMLIKQIYETIHTIKPWVRFGVSPFGIYRNKKNDPNGSDTNGLQNYDELYADVLLWVNNGWVDYTIPQIYWEIGHPAADYEKLIGWWAKHAGARPLFIGQDVMRTVKKADLDNPSINQMPRKMALQRSYPTIQGSCQWPASAVVDNAGNYKEALSKNYHKHMALPPAFSYLDNNSPKKVRKVKDVWTKDGLILFWQEPKSKSELDKAIQYVIYCFENKEKTDIEDPSKIVGITRNTYYKLPYNNGKKKYRYVITALNRVNNESKTASKKVKL